MLYYKEKIVNLGDLIVVNDFKIVLTQTIVDNNPHLFSHLEYVKLVKDWSVGKEFMGEILELSTLNNLSKFQAAPSKDIFREKIKTWIQEGYFKISTKEDFDKQELTREAIKRGFDKLPKWLVYPWQKEQKPQNPSWSVNKEFYFIENMKDSFLHKDVVIYKNGVWAKILKPLLVTDDGVELFEGSSFWIVSKKDFSFSDKILKNDPYFGKDYFKRSEFMYFSNVDLVYKYIEENNVKTLEDYENILLLNDNLADTDLENDVWEMYSWLKRNEPKLYWSKVLQLIADDLNGEINLKHSPRKTYTINFDNSFQKYVTDSWYDINSGYVQFKNEKVAKQAINIMGSKLDYIYK